MTNPIFYINKPLIKSKTSKLKNHPYRITVYDQPGRWMKQEELARLQQDLFLVASKSMDETPTYGVFSQDPRAYDNRIIGVVWDGDKPIAFTALVYLPILLHNKIEIIIHLGLTMIDKDYGGQRLQGPIFEKLFVIPSINQLKLSWTLTNIAASPAGIGSVSDYFEDAYPHYNGSTERKPYHVNVAVEVLMGYKHEFGCSKNSVFDRKDFVVIGSNEPTGGGAHQFIRTDPVSKYKVEECNEFCKNTLNFSREDELFQVAKVNIIKGIFGILRRRSTRRIEVKNKS